MQIRIVRLFCERLALRASEVNKLFIDNGIYDMIEDGYDAYHCGSDEIVYNDIKEILIQNGGCSNNGSKPKNMKSDRIDLSVDLVICMAIKDLAEELHISEKEARNKIMSSKAVELLLDQKNELWTEGPDAFVKLYKEVG